MRTTVCAVISCVLMAGGAAAGEAFKQEHPGEVALLQQEDGSFVYKSFPRGAWLYVFDGDVPGKPGCVEGCLLRWPPVYAREESKPTGDWTIVERENGRRQWAYKGQPAYTRFHDSLAKPTGVGAEPRWRLLTP
jgi:predicted lipoprotein with Yx(FWY)xxD motif